MRARAEEVQLRLTDFYRDFGAAALLFPGLPCDSLTASSRASQRRSRGAGQVSRRSISGCKR